MSAQSVLLFSMGAAAAGIGSLVALRPAVRGTTLVAAWWWSVVCTASIAGVEAAAAIGSAGEPAWIGPARFAAAMTTLCPSMALLGAKRPQDRAWHFIVLSLWVVLSLPSFEWLLFGGVAEIHAARFVFLAILVALATVNGLATRYWPSSVLSCLAQLAVIGPHLAVTHDWIAPGAGPPLGLGLLAAAWLLVAAGVPRARPAASPLARVWLDFRDLYGATWALRVMQRMSASAAMYDWPVTLAWSGFVERAGGGPAREVPPEVEQSLRTLLRRFVSPEWIDRRMESPAHAENA